MCIIIRSSSNLLFDVVLSAPIRPNGVINKIYHNCAYTIGHE